MQHRWVDNHCHLDDEEDPGAVVAESLEAGVVALVCVGVTVERSLACIELAGRFANVWATAGVHPHDAASGLDGLEDMLSQGSVVAVGECGLDYHYDHSPRPDQRDVFAAQVGFAHEYDLPLVIHTRDAWTDTFAVLDSEGLPPRTVFHCFTGGPDQAAGALERGAMLSISGIVTFGGADDLRQAVASTPLGSLMVETDSPYLAPVPHRGRRNRPALVSHVGERVAEVLGVPVEEVARNTTRNACRFYGLDVPAGT